MKLQESQIDGTFDYYMVTAGTRRTSTHFKKNVILVEVRYDNKEEALVEFNRLKEEYRKVSKEVKLEDPDTFITDEVILDFLYLPAVFKKEQ